MSKEQRFYDALEDIFVGAKVEGESGYINLMRIKSRYYEEGVFPKLKEDVDRAFEPFPEFKEELFDKLYTFLTAIFQKVVRFILDILQSIKMSMKRYTLTIRM